MNGPLALRFLGESFAVCRLPGNDGFPSWCLPSRDLLAYLRAPEETTIICEERLVPARDESPLQAG